MSIKGTVLTLLALALSALPALAADYSLVLRPDSTKVQFTLTDPLHTVHGKFDLKRGNINFNTDTGKASGQMVVDVASGSSGSDARDLRMHANVLESKTYPEAFFAPDRVDGTFSLPGTSNLHVHGLFTIHGTAHEMTLDVQTSGSADQLRTAIAFDIPYVAWGMKDPSNFLLKVGKSVHMSIEMTGPIEKH